MNGPACDNCGNPDGHPVSFDIDLPTITLCPVCSLAIVNDRALFHDLGRRPPKPDDVDADRYRWGHE